MKKSDRRYSIHTQMIVVFTLAIVITLTVAGGFCYVQTRKVIKDAQIDTMMHLLEKVALDIENKLDNAIKTTEYVLYMQDVYDSVFNENMSGGNEQREAFYRISNYLDMLATQFSFERIRIFTDNPSLQYKTEGRYFNSLSELSNMIPIDDTVRLRPYQVQIADTYLASSTKNDFRISVVRLLLEGQKLRGAVAVDLNSSMMLKDWGSSNTSIELINQDGRVLASSVSSDINACYPQELTNRIYENRYLQDHSLYYLSRPIANSNWQLVISVTDGKLMEGAQDILSAIVWTIILSCAAAGVAVWMISQRLTRRINIVTNMILSGEKDRSLSTMLANYIDEEPGDTHEISIFIRAYNQQLERIRHLVKDNERIMLRESRYRMEALRLQINSHFLYNTLASIKSYVDLHDTSAASTLVLNLADFFKHSLDRNTSFVTVQEEIDTVGIYLTIQHIVYDGTFDYEIEEVPQACADVVIPKFILQPIVENALIHGALEAAEHGRITVSSEVQGEMICLSVSDNGKGFDQQTLDHSQAEHRSDRGYGIGMWNVATRLKLYFGSEAELRLSNRPEGGGCVSLVFPKEGITEEARKAYDQAHHRG